MTHERDEIDESYKWDLGSLYESEDEWEEELETVRDEIEEISTYQGSLDSPETLLEFLELRERLLRKVNDLGSYARKRYDEDTRRDRPQKMKSLTSSLSSRLSSELSFLEPEIQEIGRESIERFMQEKEGLQEYRKFFDSILRMRPYTRSGEIEEVLSKLGDVTDTPGSVYKALMNADMDYPDIEHEGETVEVTQANLTKLLKRGDRELRRKVFKAFYGEVTDYSNTVGSTFEKNIKRNVKKAEIRGFESARQASLYPSKIDTEVYDVLVDTVGDSLEPLHRHLRLKKEVLDTEELRPYDVYMPVTQGDSPEIGYEDASEYVLEAVKPLGDGYVETARSGLEGSWVDVYENRGKRGGAYSSATYDSQPYVLMNYQDDVSSMYTLAHELGHSMHSHFTSENQPYQYSDYGIFLAEIASTVNEALLTRHLLENASGDLRRHALNHYLENFRNTLYRQTMFAEFEQRIHEAAERGEAVTASRATEIYGELKDRFHAPVENGDMIRQEWMRIPHFYYNFYVFQYATGISAAEKIVEKILNGEKDRYIEFLSSGGRKYPLETLEDLGIDMASGSPVRSAVSSYSDALDRAEEELR